MSATYKQIAVVTANSAVAFEQRTNCILRRVDNPNIVFDRNRPLTAYIIYDTDEEKEKKRNGK